MDCAVSHTYKDSFLGTIQKKGAIKKNTPKPTLILQLIFHMLLSLKIQILSAFKRDASLYCVFTMEKSSEMFVNLVRILVKYETVWNERPKFFLQNSSQESMARM